MWNQKPSLRFEIDNFSEKEDVIASNVFVAGGCEWYLSVHPKGDYGRCNDHLCLFLKVANRKSLRTGWKRSAKYYFLVLNESDEELYRSSIVSDLFCAWNPAGLKRNTFPRSKFQEKGGLEKDRLIIEVYIKVVEAFDGEGVNVPEKKETVDINGFQVFSGHVALVKKIFAEHVMKTEYKNTLSNACSKLSEMAEVGFKLDWLKSKFDEVSFKRKNADGADESLFQQLEERIKNLELMESGFKMDCLKSKLEEISLERKKSYDADGSRVQKLEESVKNLEMMELGFKLDNLKSKLEEISLERKKSYDADGSRVQKLEESVKNLEMMKIGLKMDNLKSKLEEISLERKKSYDADEFRTQKLEEQRVKNLELMELAFKLDSLDEEISLERKTDESRFQQLEERVKNIEMMKLGYKLDCLNSKLDNADESRVQQLEERVKDLELMELGYKLDCLNSKLDNADESRVQQLEERVKDLELMELGYKMNCLITKIDEVSLERKKLDDADGFRFQKLEESVKNIELMVSHLKVELDKKKDKSSADGFLLVD